MAVAAEGLSVQGAGGAQSEVWQAVDARAAAGDVDQDGGGAALEPGGLGAGVQGLGGDLGDAARDLLGGDAGRGLDLGDLAGDFVGGAGGLGGWPSSSSGGKPLMSTNALLAKTMRLSGSVRETRAWPYLNSISWLVTG